MAKIGTRELFDEYFQDKDESYLKKVRVQEDRPEVYAYEKKIGKQLIDMNVDELFDMISTFNTDGFSISYTSYDSIAVLYRKIFEYYIDNYELIRNPWNDKRMRGAAAYERLARDKTPVTWELVEAAIKEVYKVNEDDRAKYIECIIRLFYNGFEKAEEIVALKEDMIDFENSTVNLSGRVFHLDSRCMELLIYVHNMDTMKGWRGDYTMATWHDGYFKYPIRPSEQVAFETRPMGQIANLINRTISERLRKGIGFDINYRMLYFLGFYDFLVEKFGKARTNEILTSHRVREDVADLTGAARLYGITNLTATQLKKIMRPYVSE